MEWGDLTKRVEGIDHLLIDANGTGEPVAAMNDPMPYRIENPQSRIRPQPFDDFTDRFLMVTHRYRFLLLSVADCFKSNR